MLEKEYTFVENLNMRIQENEPLGSGPLVSWDIFMQGYRAIQHISDDKLALEALAKEQQWKHNFDFEEQLFQQRNSVIVTMPSLFIVYASSGMKAMSGYEPEELIGKTPHLFQGNKTTTESKMIIKQAIERNIPFESQLINYRKDGSIYNCQVKGYPVFNRSKKLVNYIAFEKEISSFI